MNIFVKVKDIKLPAVITGRLNDKDWGDRASKAIKIEMDYNDAVSLFVDNINWFIVEEEERVVETVDEKENIVHETVIETTSHDNSEYSMAGDVVDHRDGTVTVKMGKPTEIEMAMNTIDELLIAMEV